MNDALLTAYTLSPELSARADAYAHAQHTIYVVDLVWGILGLLLVLRLRLAPRIFRLAARVSQKHFWQACVFAPLFILSLALLQLPLGLWSHVVERRYGLSIQGWGSFARDFAVGQLIAMGLGAFLIWLIYAVIRRAPRRWWLWTWAALLPVLLFVFFLQPFLIDPLFYKFSPLASRDPQLAQQLHTIAAHGGQEIPLDRMLVMDASEKLRAVNAYVTGFGASKRVVVWDTSLAAMSHREIAFVFGHELGHYALGHVAILLGLNATGLLFTLWLASRLIGFLIARWGKSWGVQRVDELPSLPILILIASLLSTLGSPAGALLSRAVEHQADAFGLHVIEGAVDDPAQAAAHAFQKLGEIDLEPVDPRPLTVFWFYDHPPIRDRVRFVLSAQPEKASPGKPSPVP